MKSEELARSGDRNLVETWALMAPLIGGTTGEWGGGTFVSSGIPLSFMNGVFVTDPVDDPDGVIAAASEFMAEHGMPWLLHVRAGVDDALVDAARRAGLVVGDGPPAMALAPIPPSPPRPDGLEITVVADGDDLAVVADLTARGFGMPLEVAAHFSSPANLGEPRLVQVIGRVEGEPVTSATVVVTGTTAGIYNVATPAEHRRRGYGAAATWGAIEQGVASGCDLAVLQASDLGAPVYRAMGFVDVGRYVHAESASSRG
jgi:hypothetical protein